MRAVPPRVMSPGAYKERQKKQQEAREKAQLLLTPDTVLSIDENRSETLPDDLQDKVNNITLLHSMLEKHYVRLDETDQHNLKALVIDKLPRYIADFLLMKKEYRTSLVNVQGKNAHELLMESLGNIETHLQGIEVRANEAQLKELSVAARYTQAKN